MPGRPAHGVSQAHLPRPDAGTMVDWQAVQDGNVITARMTDFDVWIRCQVFGAPALIEAIESWLEETEKSVDKEFDL